MPGHAFIVAKFAEDAEGKGQAAFEVFPLLVFVCEGGWAGESHHLGSRRLGVNLGFMRSSGGRLSSGIVQALERGDL